MTLVLLAFFLPSVALSRVGRAQKKTLVDIGKGGARDAWQVLANGGVATACAAGAALTVVIAVELQITAAHHFTPGTTHFVIIGGLPYLANAQSVTTAAAVAAGWLAAFGGGYAAATADTWGTEIGTLVRGRPHSILTLRPIPTGMSGGVTWAGTLAEIAGAMWIAVVTAAALMLLDRSPGSSFTWIQTRHLIGPIAAGGILGAFADSVLGATAQELRRCPDCNRTCETNPHACGTPTVRVRGIPGFSNDWVNFAATFSGALVAYGLAAR